MELLLDEPDDDDDDVFVPRCFAAQGFLHSASDSGERPKSGEVGVFMVPGHGKHPGGISVCSDGSTELNGFSSASAGCSDVELLLDELDDDDDDVFVPLCFVAQTFLHSASDSDKRS